MTHSRRFVYELIGTEEEDAKTRWLKMSAADKSADANVRKRSSAWAGSQSSGLWWAFGPALLAGGSIARGSSKSIANFRDSLEGWSVRLNDLFRDFRGSLAAYSNSHVVKKASAVCNGKPVVGVMHC
jgi:hypothetical protein